MAFTHALCLLADSWTTRFLLASVILLISTRLYLQCKGKLIQCKLPPGPPNWPIVGNLLDFGPLPHRDMHRMHQKYGPIVYLKLGCVNLVTTNDPHVMREILITQDHVFASRPNSIAIEYISYKSNDLVFAPYGHHWKAMRRVCLENLLTPKRLQSFGPQRLEEAQYIMHEIWKKAQEGKEIHLRHFLTAFTMNCVTWMLLRKRYYGGEPGEEAADHQNSKFTRTLREMFLMVGMLNIGDYFPALRWLDLQGHEKRIKELHKTMDELQGQILEEHREMMRKGERDEIPNFVDVLLSLELPDTVIKALVQDMLAAGTDTSTVTSEWAMTELLRHPEVIEKAQEELDSVVGKERMVVESDLDQLPYLRCIVMETLRLRPTGSFLIPHYSMRDTTVAGYTIPAKTQILINMFSHGRNPKVWGNDPPLEEFHPERHKLHKGTEIPSASYVMFGTGRRRCPGANLGMTLVMFMLARLLHSFNWAPVPPTTIDDIDTTEVFGLTLSQATPLVAIAIARLHPHLYK